MKEQIIQKISPLAQKTTKKLIQKKSYTLSHSFPNCVSQHSRGSRLNPWRARVCKNLLFSYLIYRGIHTTILVSQYRLLEVQRAI
jgi:hypothetical protein